MHHADFLQPILILMFSAILGVMLVQKFRLSPILGYFLAGLTVGPYGFGLVKNTASISTLAEIGVAFLLFDIGLHLSFRSLWEARKDLFGLGPMQIFSSGFVIALIAYWFLRDVTAAIVIGFSLSLSSTAFIMQVLKERREQNTPLGKSALSISIVQDIFVVFLLILLPHLSAKSDDLMPIMAWALFKAIIALLAVSGVGRFLLRPIFEKITATKNSEVFTASALLFVLATAWGVSQLGLSLPLGAFLAGLALSESDFCYLVKTEIYPFRGLLLGLFFITIGMSLNWPLAFTNGGTIVMIILALLTAKSVLLAVAARMMGYCKGFSIRLGLILSEGSEFSFVLFGLALTQGLILPKTSQFLQLAVGVTLVLTPALDKLGRFLSGLIENQSAKKDNKIDKAEAETSVLITGFDQIGQDIAKVLEAEGIQYIAFDNNRERIAETRSRGFLVDYTDIHRPKTATWVSLGKAKAVVDLVDDLEASVYLVDALKSLNPELSVYAATSNRMTYDALLERDLTDILLKDSHTAHIISEALLRLMKVDEQRIQDRMERVKREAG